MFKKKKCSRCNEKMKKSYNFCPYCGKDASNNENSKNFGMLGKNDFENIVNEIKLPAGINLLFNSLAKTLDKQFKEMDKEVKKQEKYPKGISISIATGGIPGMNFNNRQEVKKQKFSKQISEEKIKKMSNLPKEEPITTMKRLSNSILYEVKMPGVKSIENVSINSFENSIEIKGISKEKTYFKIIPFELPIINYSLEKGILTIEFETNN